MKVFKRDSIKFDFKTILAFSVDWTRARMDVERPVEKLLLKPKQKMIVVCIGT